MGALSLTLHDHFRQDRLLPVNLSRGTRSRFPLLTSGSRLKFWTSVQPVPPPRVEGPAAAPWARFFGGWAGVRPLLVQCVEITHRLDLRRATRRIPLINIFLHPPPSQIPPGHRPVYSDIPIQKSSPALQVTDATHTPMTRDDTCHALKQIGPESHRRFARSGTLQSSLRSVL